MDIIGFKMASPGNKGTIFYVVLIALTIATSIIIQIYYAQSIHVAAWSVGCGEGEYRAACLATTSVLRFSFALVCFLCFEMICTFMNAKYYDSLLPFRVVLYIGTLIGFMYISSEVMLGYAWFARFAGFIFLIYQQLIFIDIAYNWNEFWVARSEASSNYSWLYALVITSLFLFAAAISVMGLLFWQFYKPDCTENDAVLILTVLLCTFVTMLQLFVSESGSLLVSAIVTAYCTYLCYSSLSLNPEAACNPTLSTRYQQASQGIGIALTIISLTYTAYSTVGAAAAASCGEEVAPKTEREVDPNLSGVLEGGQPVEQSETKAVDSTVSYQSSSLRQILFLVLAIFITLAAYYAMVLTNWATIQSNSSLSDPRYGTVALWINASGQWIALLIYAWSLVASRIFPDRDFS